MRRDKVTCPCGQCKAEYNYSERQYETAIRNCPATENELALLARARETTDAKKLAAMMPAWLKTALYKPVRPFVFVPDRAPVYPTLHAPKPSLERPDPFQSSALQSAPTIADYVECWNALNNFKTC